jgi:hypothetical protein
VAARRNVVPAGLYQALLAEHPWPAWLRLDTLRTRGPTGGKPRRSRRAAPRRIFVGSGAGDSFAMLLGPSAAVFGGNHLDQGTCWPGTHRTVLPTSDAPLRLVLQPANRWRRSGAVAQLRLLLPEYDTSALQVIKGTFPRYALRHRLSAALRVARPQARRGIGASRRRRDRRPRPAEKCPPRAALAVLCSAFCVGSVRGRVRDRA